MIAKDSRHHHSYVRRLRFSVITAVSLGLSALLLWVLVAFSDPQATLCNLNLRNNNESSTMLYMDVKLMNKNLFRGFNYSSDGWIECFYVLNDTYRQLDFEFFSDEYQGFKKNLNWNFTLNLSSYEFDWDEYSEPLKNQASRIYVSLFLVYRHKILFWTSKTIYYQWLDANAYVNDSFSLKEITHFHRMKNISIGIST